MILSTILSLATAFLIVYTILIILSLYLWVPEKIDAKIKENSGSSELLLSIIVVARNEALRIGSCIYSIQKQNIPFEYYEIILIDDHSSDNTIQNALIAAKGNVTVLELKNFKIQTTNSFKKKAIQLGLSKANGEVIVFTDADCIVPPNWLSTISNYFKLNKDVKALAMPITLINNRSSILSLWQSIDTAATMVFTNMGLRKSWFYNANGANWACRRNALLQIQEKVKTKDYLASGDDTFAIVSIADVFGKKSVKYLPSQTVLVKTFPEDSWKQLIQQRIRWASKQSMDYNNKLNLLYILVFLLHALLILALMTSIYCGVNVIYALSIVCLKMAIDTIFFIRIQKFFRIIFPYTSIILLEIYYAVYIIGMPFMSLFIKEYNWKDRKIK